MCNSSDIKHIALNSSITDIIILLKQLSIEGKLQCSKCSLISIDKNCMCMYVYFVFIYSCVYVCR